MPNITGKTALVTGASRGMGRAAALALAAGGARIIVHYGRKADEAKTVVDQIRAAGGRADALSADLAAPDGAHKLAAQVRNLTGDRLDILVSNAGISNAALKKIRVLSQVLITCTLSETGRSMTPPTTVPPSAIRNTGAGSLFAR